MLYSGSLVVVHHVQLTEPVPDQLFYPEGVEARNGGVPAELRLHVDAEARLVFRRPHTLLVEGENLDLKLASAAHSSTGETASIFKCSSICNKGC